MTILGTEPYFKTYKEIQDYVAKYNTAFPFWLASPHGYATRGVPQIVCAKQVGHLMNPIVAALGLHKVLKATTKKPRI